MTVADPIKPKRKRKHEHKPKSVATLQELDQSHVIGTYVRSPVHFVRGEGVRLWDDKDREYLDFLAGISVLNVGHCHRDVIAAITEQAKKLTHVSNLFYNQPATQLSQELAESALGGKVFLCNSGAEANEAAIKLARRRTPRGKVIVLEGGFHGRTYGALSATPQKSKQAPFKPLVAKFVTVPKDPSELRKAVDDDTAAVLLEPIQGESGIHPLSNELLITAREACNQYDAALIFDEVQTGMGRTGTLWAYQGGPVIPDAITSAKALGGGVPIGALITGPKLADVLQLGDHGSTFAGNPLVCAAARVALDICKDQELLDEVNRLGEILSDGLRKLPHVVGPVRGRGLMLGVDLDVDAVEVAQRALEDHRLVINATGPHTLRFEPPLIVKEAEIREALERLGKLLA